MRFVVTGLLSPFDSVTSRQLVVRVIGVKGLNAVFTDIEIPAVHVGVIADVMESPQLV